MADEADKVAGFVRRWSRRKLGTNLDSGPTPKQESTLLADEGQNSTVAEDLDQFDFDTLEFSSDFTRFMRRDVPSHLRAKGLKALWTSHDTISRPDDLDDYLEDFSEDAMALPPELVKSAYEIGCGFLNNGQPQKNDDGSDTQVRSTDVVPPLPDQSPRPGMPHDRANDLESNHYDPEPTPSRKP